MVYSMNPIMVNSEHIPRADDILTPTGVCVALSPEGTDGYEINLT